MAGGQGDTLGADGRSTQHTQETALNTERTLIRGATVITMDTQGDLPVADILVTGDRIEQIAPGLVVEGAQVVDASGCIAIPGLVNAHMHTWQTALRGVAANWTLLQYFKNMHAGLATVFTPGDLHIATLVGALNQINCGTTTLVDWCHNNPTPAHNDAAVAALLDRVEPSVGGRASMGRPPSPTSAAVGTSGRGPDACVGC